MFYINKWQRLVFGVGAIVCAFRSFSIWWNEDGSPGSAFVATILMTVFALGPKKPGEEVLPLATHIRNNSRALAIAVTGLVAGLVIIVWAVNRESDYAAEEALADTVEMPAEEAMPADSSSPVIDAMAPTSAPTSGENSRSVSEIDAALDAMAAARAAEESALQREPYSEAKSDETDRSLSEDAMAMPAEDGE